MASVFVDSLSLGRRTAPLVCVLTLLAACDGSPGTAVSTGGQGRLPPSGRNDGGTAATSGNTDIDVVPTEGGSSAVTAITVSPLALTPDFSPDIKDYYVRCAAGDNLVTLTVTDGTGSEPVALDLAEDQAFVVRGQYWIRCLPHDFPQITVAHPSEGAPTPGFYLVNTAAYAIVLDSRATPVWYARGTNVGDVDALQTNTISLMPSGTAPYGTSPTAEFDLHSLDTEVTTHVKASGSPTDLHDLRLLPNGDYLVFSYVTESSVNLTGLSTFGEDERMADCEIQEVDASGELVWSWLASAHVDPITESLEPQSNTINGQAAVDVFHCNSIDVDASGNLLVSMRHTNSLFYVNRSTGKIVWKLGGTATNKDGASCIQVVGDPEGTFNMQHDARFRPNGNISLFDDHGATSGVARGVEYSIDQEARTATLVWQFLGTTQSKYEGSLRRYDDGESVIGWGGASPDARVITEVDANGNDVLDVSFTPIAAPYRAVKVPVAMLDIGRMRATAALW